MGSLFDDNRFSVGRAAAILALAFILVILIFWAEEPVEWLKHGGKTAAIVLSAGMLAFGVIAVFWRVRHR